MIEEPNISVENIKEMVSNCISDLESTNRAELFLLTIALGVIERLDYLIQLLESVEETES